MTRNSQRCADASTSARLDWRAWSAPPGRPSSINGKRGNVRRHRCSGNESLRFTGVCRSARRRARVGPPAATCSTGSCGSTSSASANTSKTPSSRPLTRPRARDPSTNGVLRWRACAHRSWLASLSQDSYSGSRRATGRDRPTGRKHNLERIKRRHTFHSASARRPAEHARRRRYGSRAA